MTEKKQVNNKFFKCYKCLDTGRKRIRCSGPGDERESDYVKCDCQKTLYKKIYNKIK